MYILIPINRADIEEASLVKINDAAAWVQLFVEEGKLQETVFSEERDVFVNPSQAVVVINDSEYVWPFMEQNMMVLVAHVQRSIDDIVEAYLFKELNELAY